MQTATLSFRTGAVDQDGTPQETALCAGTGTTAAAALRVCLKNAHLFDRRPDTCYVCRLFDEAGSLVLVAFEMSPLEAVRDAQAMNRKASQGGGR